jgi:hypothetical protein
MQPTRRGGNDFGTTNPFEERAMISTAIRLFGSAETHRMTRSRRPDSANRSAMAKSGIGRRCLRFRSESINRSDRSLGSAVPSAPIAPIAPIGLPRGFPPSGGHGNKFEFLIPYAFAFVDFYFEPPAAPTRRAARATLPRYAREG